MSNNVKRMYACFNCIMLMYGLMYHYIMLGYCMGQHIKGRVYEI